MFITCNQITEEFQCTLDLLKKKKKRKGLKLAQGTDFRTGRGNSARTPENVLRLDSCSGTSFRQCIRQFPRIFTVHTESVDFPVPV